MGVHGPARRYETVEDLAGPAARHGHRLRLGQVDPGRSRREAAAPTRTRNGVFDDLGVRAARRRLPRPAADHLLPEAAARPGHRDAVPDAADGRSRSRSTPSTSSSRPYQTSFYLPKQAPKLEAAISEEIRAMYESGEMAELIEKWGGEPEQFLTPSAGHGGRAPGRRPSRPTGRRRRLMSDPTAHVQGPVGRTTRPTCCDGAAQDARVHGRRLRRRRAARPRPGADAPEPGCARCALPAAVYTELFKNIPLLAIIFLTYFGLPSQRRAAERRSRPARSAWSSSTRPTCRRSSARRSPACTAASRRRAEALGLSRGATFAQVIFPQALRLGAARHQHDAGRPAQVDVAAGHDLRRRADVARAS